MAHDSASATVRIVRVGIYAGARAPTIAGIASSGAATGRASSSPVRDTGALGAASPAIVHIVAHVDASIGAAGVRRIALIVTSAGANRGAVRRRTASGSALP